MYFSPKKHILSRTLLIVALIRLLCMGLSGGLRLLLRRGGAMPDMADTTIWAMQTFFSVVSLLLSAVIFLRALRTVHKSLALIPKEDRHDMGQLQEEFFGAGRSALTADAIRKLLWIWMVILVGAQLIYDLSSVVYRWFALSLANALAGGETGEAYIFLYNLTHGFKYQGMMIALLLGGMMTGIFLGDRLLCAMMVGIAALFMLASARLGMATLEIMGQSIGIVWSSGIFHAMETVGLVVLALYMRMKYHGV